ncbi:MAG: hypothetical protein H6865_02965 [Rhodospirillales bacterium]|nr:hypothetical protein [Alphaproteobacteria bacterium]MCB9986578.1 hypothetical protein [Rhodospirillales bacterium]USO06891.1 MAG: hypothetical protein H6866_05420 [Rhodospirillales bacterium]
MKPLLGLALAAAFVLTSCADYKKANDAIETNQATADRALEAISPKQPPAQTLEIDSRPYYGSSAVPIANGSPLPPKFEQSNSIVMTFARPVTMAELARMVQSVTGLRAQSMARNESSSAAGDSAASSAASLTFLPTGGEQVAGGRIVWQGRLSDLLNQAADNFDADWTFDGSTITFAQTVTRTFMLHALASEMSVNGSVSGGAGQGDSGALPKEDISSKVSIKVWDEIKDAVSTIIGDSGKAAFSPSTGTITVTGSPDAVRQVESYLNQQNAMRLRRVAVAVKVLSITANNDMDLSADVTGILKRAFDQASLRTVGGATSGIAIGVLKKPIGIESYTPGDGSDGDMIQSDRIVSAFKADRNIGRVSVVHSGAIVTLSDQPAPLQVGRQISYLERTSSTTGDTTGSGSVSLEPGTVNTGLMMTILPRIVENNRILMRLSVALTDAPQPFATYGSSASGVSIQLPEVNTTGFMQNAVMTSGETLVLAGFEKNLDSNTDDGTPFLPFLGGKRSTSRTREVTVLLITSEILPEDPITVIGN